MSTNFGPRLRGIIHVLKAQKTAPTRNQFMELEALAKEVESSQDSLSEAIQFRLRVLLSCTERTSQGVYRILDSDLFVWALDELNRLTDYK